MPAAVGEGAREEGGARAWARTVLYAHPSPPRVPTPGAAQAMATLGHLCAELTGTRESLLVWSGNRTPQAPPARRPAELNCHIGNSKVNTNR